MHDRECFAGRRFFLLLIGLKLHVNLEMPDSVGQIYKMRGSTRRDLGRINT
jgi:hypothetical protein